MSIRNQLLQDILSAIGGGGSVLWGSITGSITNQTDLAEVAKTNDYDDLTNKPDLSANITGGWANYNDLATQTTLVNIVGGAPAVKVPNDALGGFTFEDFLPAGVSTLYNATTQQIDMTDFNVGDMLSLRFDLEVTTSSNSQEVEISAVFAIGSPSEFTTVLAQGSKKLAGNVGFFRDVSFAAFNADFKDFPAELRISSGNDCTLKVNGYFMRAGLIGRG